MSSVDAKRNTQTRIDLWIRRRLFFLHHSPFTSHWSSDWDLFHDNFDQSASWRNYDPNPARLLDKVLMSMPHVENQILGTIYNLCINKDEVLCFLFEYVSSIFVKPPFLSCGLRPRWQMTLRRIYSIDDNDQFVNRRSNINIIKYVLCTWWVALYWSTWCVFMCIKDVCKYVMLVALYKLSIKGKSLRLSIECSTIKMHDM